MERVRIVNSQEDGLDRLLISFKDAKVSYFYMHCVCHGLSDKIQIALLEWSDATHDLLTVSIHTYERAPQMASSQFSLQAPSLTMLHR